MLAVIGVIISATLGGAYVATRPCLITKCNQLKTAQNLNNSYEELTKEINSQQDLARLQRQIDSANTNLEQIPNLSPYSQESQRLSLSLTEEISKNSTGIYSLSSSNDRNGKKVLRLPKI